MVAVKLIPHFLCWAGIVLVLLRGSAGRRFAVLSAGISGFACGGALAFMLTRSFPGDFAFGIIRDAVGGSFLLLWGVAAAALYRATGRELRVSLADRIVNSPFAIGAASFLAGAVAGAICASRFAGADGNAVTLLLLVLAAALIAFGALFAERFVPASCTVSWSGLMAMIAALLLYSSASLIRLDLFAPLTMKVMKFTHDFVHQFFESMLIPDHLFFSPGTWNYIGLLFSKGVGFWGALLLWFTPVALVIMAVYLERMPSVAHIRQGAQRRKLLAAAFRARRFRLVFPVLAVVLLTGAVYRSQFPSVEYWDPKPIPVTATPAGEIFIPKKGEVELEDGKLHKYIYRQGDREARFFVIMTPSGEWSVDLDACAICKPDGYGQTEGTIICYYCKTLIPLETVGQQGGCNPVPVRFKAADDGIHIDGATLINTWTGTVQSTSRTKEVGK